MRFRYIFRSMECFACCYGDLRRSRLLLVGALLLLDQPRLHLLLSDLKLIQDDAPLATLAAGLGPVRNRRNNEPKLEPDQWIADAFRSPLARHFYCFMTDRHCDLLTPCVLPASEVAYVMLHIHDLFIGAARCDRHDQRS